MNQMMDLVHQYIYNLTDKKERNRMGSDQKNFGEKYGLYLLLYIKWENHLMVKFRYVLETTK